MDYNPFVIVPLATWAVAQVTKFTIAALKGDVDFRKLYASGGMPSVHAAVTMSLAVTALLIEGADSPIFGLAAVFAAIVMYDSVGVRRSVGEHSRVINAMVDGLDKGNWVNPGVLRVAERLGHYPAEVLVGAVLGTVLGGILNYDHLGPFTNWLQVYPQRLEVFSYFGLFGALVVLGLAFRLVLARRYRKSMAWRVLGRRVLSWSQTVGWIGLGMALLVYERASYFAWRLWPVLVLAIGLWWIGWVVNVTRQELPEAWAQEQAVARKRKWLNWGRKNRKKR
jgi:acid phosphatase family membrane protein YuiD